jgi:hypothetical protein
MRTYCAEQRVFSAVFLQSMHIRISPELIVPYERRQHAEHDGFSAPQKENTRTLILIEQKQDEILLPIRKVFTARYELNI